MSTSRISDITKTHSIEGIDLNVNLVNGKYTLSTNIIDFFKDNYNISIDLNYIGDDTFSYHNFHLGAHLRLSINEYIRRDGNVLYYIDGADIKHEGYKYYEKVINNTTFWYFKFSDGIDLKAKCNMAASDNTIILSDNIGNYKEFIKKGSDQNIFLLKRVVYIGENDNYIIEKVLTYDEEFRLEKIYDSRRPLYYIQFLYNENNYIEKICYKTNYKTYGVLLKYDESGNLCSITRIANKHSYISHIFKYNNSKLSQIINAYTYESIKLFYSNNKVDRIEEGYVDKKNFAFKSTIYANEENTKNGIYVVKASTIDTSNTFNPKYVYNYTYNTNNRNTIVRYASVTPNEAIISYIYEYDTWGRLMSAFEKVSDHNFKTLTKQNGVWLVDSSESSSGNYPNGQAKETINGIVSKYVSNNKIIYDTNSDIVSNFITYNDKYKNATEQDYLIYNFKVSVKLFSPSSTNNIIVSIGYTDNTWADFDARIIKYETGVYQTVSVQVEVNNYKTISKIAYSVDSNSFIINNMYASIGLAQMTFFSSNFITRFLKDITDINITTYNNQTDAIDLSGSYYITYNDVYNTYLSYVRNTFLFNDNSFDLYLNEGRFIKRVKSVIYKWEFENWYLYTDTTDHRFTLANSIYNMFSDTLTTKNYYFYSSYSDHMNVLVEVERSRTDNKTTIYDLKGNLLETVDSYGVVTKYQYDHYNQVIRQEISRNNTSEKFINTITRGLNYTKEGSCLGSNTYYYDEIGNITQSVLKDNEDVDISSKIYNKDSLDNIIQIEDSSHKNNIRYEESGNISSYNSIYNSLDQSNRMINHTFTYDDENRFLRHYYLNKSQLEENDNYRISTYYNDSNRSITNYFRRVSQYDTLISTYNKYGKTTSLKYNDNGNYINYVYEENDESSICANIKNVNDNIEGLYKTYTYEDGNISKIEEKDANNELVISKEIFPNKEKYKLIYDDYERSFLYEQVYETNNVSPRLASISNEVFEKAYEYDCFGRIRKASTSDFSNSFEESIIYESIEIDNELHATNRIVEQEYNLRPDLSNPYYNVLTFNYSYDRLNNISEYSLVANNNSLNHHYNHHDYEYTYNNDSVLTKEKLWIKDINSNVLSYKEISYNYDLHGNITSKNIKEGPDDDHITNNTTYNYSYTNNKLVSISDSNNQLVSTFTYDYYGNTISFDGLNLTYIRGSVLSSITNGTDTYDYHYNSEGIRYKKIINDAETIYGLDGNKIIYEKGTNNFLYLYEGNEIIGIYDLDAFIRYFFVKDITGNIISIVHNNVEVNRYKYDAYGNCEVYTYNHNGELVIDVDNTSIGNKNPFRYKSYYLDIESGLYYLNTRYYNPKIGRFITIDNINYIDENSIYGYNLYCYCGNNPVMYSDGDGSFPILTLILAGTFALGFGSSLFMNAATNNWQLDWRDFLQAGVDGAFAVGATMLAMTGIGFAGSIAAGAAMGWSQYAIGVGIQGDSITLAGSLTAIGIGALGGAISGAGAANSANIGKNMIGLSDDGVRAIGAITNAANRKAAGIISAKGLQATLNLYGKTAFNAVQAAIPGTMRRLFLSSARKIAFYTVLANVSQSGLNYGYKAWGLI